MKFLRWGEVGAERPGVMDAAGRIRDLSAVTADIDGAFLSQRPDFDPESLPIVDPGTRLGPCIARPGKLICVGLNFADHAREGGFDIPTEPVLFMKAPTAIVGPNDPVIIPKGAEKLDWEVELAFAIGTRAQNVPEGQGAGHIAGYCVLNDLSERAWQLEMGGQWLKGKSHDGFAPTGPWLVDAAAFGETRGRRMWLELDGALMQDGSTDTMIFPPGFIVEYISRFMTLEPGDLVTTGTPPGVGMGKCPPVYLRPGQAMRLGIDGLGEQSMAVVAA